MSVSVRTPRVPRLHHHHISSDSSADDDSGDLSTGSEGWEESWSVVNERKVTEITLNFLYMPRTLTLLALIMSSLVIAAFMRPTRHSDDDNNNVSYDSSNDDYHRSHRQANTAAGFCYSCFLFLSIGLLVFPNGPYTRPHPALWRLVFGMSFLYFLLLSFVLFQSFEDVQLLLKWADPHLRQSNNDSTKLYAVDCALTLHNVRSRMDIFIPAHFVGWVFKSLLVRHAWLLWTISVMWECTELFFAHVLPNFYECWWDALLLDVVLCNGLGILVGMALCRRLEVREFHWESIRDIKGTKNKLKRVILQFTPQEWSKIRWLDPSSTYMRVLAIFVLILSFQITELNTFLLKHIFAVPTGHYFNLARLFLLMLIGAPSVRQYYVYVTDKTCKRLGTQAWVYFGVMVTELLISVRYGADVLPRPALVFMLGWLCSTAFLSIVMVTLNTRTKIKRRLTRSKVYCWLFGADKSISSKKKGL